MSTPGMVHQVGYGLPKLIHLGGGGGGGGGTKNFARKRGETLKREVDLEMGGLPLFYYFTAQSHLLCMGGVVWGE